MAKINIDTNMIGNNLYPLAKNEVTKLSNAISLANRVFFPNGEYDWSGIVGDLNDCKQSIDKYIRWLEDMNEKYINHMTDRVDEISSVKITELKKHDMIVK